MVLTVVLPKKLHRQIEETKRKTGMSKSLIVRQILLNFYEKNQAA